jgi:uncharacterized membrane protein YkoI
MKFMGLPMRAFKIKDIEPIGIEITTENIKEALGTDLFANYIKGKIGINIVEEEISEDKIILNTLNSLSPIVASKLMNSISANELRRLLKLPEIADGDKASELSQEVFAANKEDKLLFKLTNELGESKDKFEIVMHGQGYDFDIPADLKGDNKKVYNVLVKTPDMTLAALSKATNITEAKLVQILEQLSKGNVIASKLIEKNGVVSVRSEANEPPNVDDAKKAQEDGFVLETKWEYAWTNPDDAKTKDRSRDFCVKMLEANRLYDRSEIDALQNDMDSDQFNQSVWRYRGGWYHNPDLNVNTPQCRHYWKSVITKRKK